MFKNMTLNDYSIEEGIRLRRMSSAGIRARQTELMKAHLLHASKSAFYQRLFREADFSPDSFSSLELIENIPFTERGQLSEYEADFYAVPNSEFVDLVQTSGTDGRPLTIGYTQADLQRLAYNEAMAYSGAGFMPGETCLITVTLDSLFIAGMAYYLGALMMNMRAVRSGPGRIDRQLELIRTLSPSVIVGVPSFLAKVADYAIEKGMDDFAEPVQGILAIGEPVRRPDMGLNALGNALSTGWNARVISTYAATELETAFCECVKGRGGHVHPELCIAEVVDDFGRILSDGELGELVVTPLGVEGMPLVRYKTGDMTRMYSGQCECGWNTPRIGPIEGRKSQRLKYRGTTVYPQTILRVLHDKLGIDMAYIEVTSAYDLSDSIKVVVGEPQEISAHRAKEIENAIQSIMRVKPQVILRSKEEVENKITGHGGRKPKQFFDLRGRA